jgi:hypothetical protein
MSNEMPENLNESFDMLPIEAVDNFEVGDSILIKAESKDGQEIIESFDSLEGAKNFILTDPRYKPETLNIELVKDSTEE